MTRFLLDTSIMLDILEGNRSGLHAREFLEKEPFPEVVTNILCFCEVLNKTSLAKLSAAEKLLSNFSIFPITLSDGDLAKKFQYSCRTSGNYVPTIDCIIAATAVNNNATLVASDSDFERIQEVKRIIF